MTAPQVWGRERLEELEALVGASLGADDQLSADELEGVCFEGAAPGRSVVLGLADGGGAVAACLRDEGGHPVGYLNLLVVEPGARGAGRGAALAAAGEAWCWDQGAREVRPAASAPFYLWPGVDVRSVEALALLEARGYTTTGCELNLGAPTRFPAGERSMAIGRVLEDSSVGRVVELVREAWPHWEPEVRRSIEHATCVAAVDPDEPGGPVLGVACHSVNRLGWVGPIGTRPAAQRRGVGRALLAAVGADLAAAGLERMEIAWVGPVGFYLRTCGARTSRVFRTASLPRP